jgi:hypothetical protein
MQSEQRWKEFTAMNILLNIRPLAQRDPRWSSDKMGTTNIPIGNQGCLMVAWTMVVRYLLGLDVYPDEINGWLGANGGYQDGNLFVWSVSKKYDPRLTFGHRYNGAYLDKIDEQLAKRMPVIVNVDLYPNTPTIEQHWVLIVGKMNGRYIIHDPWFGAQLWFDEWYGNPNTGVRIVCTYNFTGDIPDPLPVPPVENGEPMYNVKVKAGVTSLVIRSAPIVSSSTDTGKRAKYPEEYTVYEEKNGYGRIGAGRWISLTYVDRIGTSGEPTDVEKLRILWDWYEESK